MSDYVSQMKSGADLSLNEQKNAGTPIGGDMSDEHKKFVQTLSLLIEKGTIDPANLESFLNPSVYQKLEDSIRAKVDMSLPNIATLLRHIIDFYRSKQTPDACPQLQTMIDQLWEMKERVEVHGDILTF